MTGSGNKKKTRNIENEQRDRSTQEKEGRLTQVEAAKGELRKVGQEHARRWQDKSEWRGFVRGNAWGVARGMSL